MLGVAKHRKSRREKQDGTHSSSPLLLSSIEARHQGREEASLGEAIAHSLNAIEKKLMEMSQELACPICLGILEDAVSLPCTHCFCNICFERSVTIKPTRRNSLSTSSQCPLCKAHINKRSSSPADAIRTLVKAYQRTIMAYEADTGKQWEAVESELGRQEFSNNPIENLSQLYLYPEKQKQKVNVVIQRKKSHSSRREGKSDRIESNAAGISSLSNKDMIVCASLLNKNQQETLVKWASTFNINVSPHLTPDVKHLIVKTDSQRMTKKSLKYCQAILGGRWIISFECKCHFDPC
jgi:C3HC4-type zinc finger (RING finger) protein